MDDKDFFQHLRLTKPAFTYLLDNIKKDDTPPRTHGKKKVSTTEGLLLTLWFLGNKTSFRETAFQFRRTISAVHRLFYSTVLLICELAKKVITWPSDIDMTQNEFVKIANIPGIVGAIDATHINVRPPEDNQKDYLDRMMNHSEVLLAVCDAKMRFTHISTGFPGSIHDQRCLDLSHNLSAAIKTPPNDFFPRNELHLVGDSGFKLETALLVPYKDIGNLTEKQRMYNKKLSKSRVVIENAFGFLKGRFRCLKHLEVDIENVTSIIVACCVIHNVALMFPDKLTVPELSEYCDDTDNEEHIFDPQSHAVEKRNFICNNLP